MTSSEQPSSPRAILADIGASFMRTLPDHLPLYFCAVVFCGATFVITSAYNIRLEPSAGIFFLGMIAQLAIIAFAGLVTYEFIVLMRAGFPDRPLGKIAKSVGTRLVARDRPGNILHALIALTPLMISFSALKDRIPAMHPFAWDKTFSAWDRFIGFGHQPWEVLQPVLGHLWVTAGLNFFYDAWFLVMFTVLFSQAFAARRSVLRMQFLLAFSFAWFIAGNVLATVFSSAGPCFYGLLKIGPDPYAAQMSYLHAVAAQLPSWTTTMQDTSVQNLLWTSYVADANGVGGISAMPSMHLTSTMLMTLLAWRINRKLGLAFTLFLIVIFVGSIHLAWHYAVDGIAGMTLATIFWVAAGAVARTAARLSPAQAIHPAQPMPEATGA